MPAAIRAYRAGFLPDTRSSSPLRLRSGPKNETYTAGDVYYGAPGHVPLCFADSEVIEFSPAAELEKTMAAVGKNMQMAGHG